MATRIAEALLTPLYLEGETVESQGQNEFEIGGIVRVGTVSGNRPSIIVDEGGQIADGTVSLKGQVSSTNRDIGTLFRGSFEIPTGQTTTSKVAYAGNQPSNRYKLAGIVDLDISRLTFRDGVVDALTGFKLPELLGGFRLPNNIQSQLTLGANGATLTGGKISIPKTIPINIRNLLKLNISNATFEYVSQPSTFLKIQGKADLELPKFLKGAKATVDLADPNYVQYSDRGLDVVGSLSIRDVPIAPKVFEIKRANLKLDTTKGNVDADAKVLLPKNIEVNGNISFRQGQLDSVYVEGNNLNIPIPNTGVFLQRVGGGVSNLANTPANANALTTVQLNTGLTAAKRITIPLPNFLGGPKTGSLVAIDGQVNITREGISGNVKGSLLGGFVPIADANIKAELDWSRGTLGIEGRLNVASVIEYNARLNANKNFDISAGGRVTLKVPKIKGNIVSKFLSGKELGGAEGLFYFTNNNNSSDDFVAGWLKIGKVKVAGIGTNGKRQGIKIGFDGSVKTIGGKEIDRLPRNIARASRALSSEFTAAALSSDNSATFSVEPNKEYVLLNASWTNAANNVPVEVIGPDGRIYTQADFAAGQKVEIVEDLSDPNQVTIAVNQPEGGNWTIQLGDTSQLGEVEFDALEDTADPTVQITNVAYDPTQKTVTINYQADDPDSLANVSLYYDTNGNGQDGVTIAHDLSEGNGTFTFDASDLETDEYFFYAVASDDDNVPTINYFAKPITIASTEAIALGQVQQVEADWIGDDTVEVSWQPIAGAAYYVISYNSDATQDEDAETVVSSEDENSVEIADLVPGETYRFQVQAVSEAEVYGMESEAALVTVGDGPEVSNEADEWEETATPGEIYTEEIFLEEGETLSLIDPIPGASLNPTTGEFTWQVPTDADGWYEFNIQSKNEFGEVEVFSFEVLAESNKILSATDTQSSAIQSLATQSSTTQSFLVGGLGNDYLDGNAQNNLLVSKQGDDTLVGRGGNDTLDCGSGKDIADGGDGNDFLNGGLDEDQLSGVAGNDTVLGGMANDFITGGSGDDAIYGNQDTDTLLGGEGKDRIYGGKESDFIAGNQDDDYLSGDKGSDSIYGGRGDDVILGGNDADYLSGDKGNDTILGNVGEDTLLGGLGNDLLIGNQDDNILYGGDGEDSLVGDAGDDDLEGDAGNDTLSGGVGDDLLSGSQGNDILSGDDGFDTLSGGDQNDQLSGDAGDDLLSGDNGSDSLFGGDGDDLLMGANGSSASAEIDTLTGGAGTDVFMVGDETLSYYTKFGKSDYALITDFDTAEDVIGLQGSESDYRLATVGSGDNLPGGIGIFRRQGISEDLIAIVQGNQQLSLDSGDFVLI